MATIIPRRGKSLTPTQVKQQARQINRRLRKIGDELAVAAGKGLFEHNRLIIKRAIGYTPVDTGLLRGSAFVNRPFRTSKGFTSLAGFKAKHAIPVHEMVHVQRRVGQPKFLQRAVNELGGDLTETVKTHQGRVLKKWLTIASRGR